MPKTTIAERVTRLEELADTLLKAQIKTEEQFRETDRKIAELAQSTDRRIKELTEFTDKRIADLVSAIMRLVEHRQEAPREQ